jgi:hypothetical protein
MVNIADITGFDARFEELARRWEHHQNLRRSGAGIADLACSRRALDEARNGLRG